MQATADRTARAGDANPFLRLIADLMAGCAALFGLSATPARQAQPVAKVPAPEAAPAALSPAPEPVAVQRQAAPAPDLVPAIEESRSEPTALGQRVLSALNGHGPMRKCDIAELVGIGRGSANRIVERLVIEGWMRKTGEDTYALA